MQEKFVKILTDLLYSLPESDTCEWCGLERCKPICVRIRAMTFLEELRELLPAGKQCPFCHSKTFPRKGFHFDHERRCCKCDWIGK